MQSGRTLFILLFLGIRLFAQSDTTSAGATEVTVIDSYITPELPNKFVLSFFTSDSCTSKLMIEQSKMVSVSENLSEDHKIEIELDRLNLHRLNFHYQIIVYDAKGAESRSELFEVALPESFNISKDMDPGLFGICLGSIVFAIPSPTYLFINGEKHWSLSKEIPLVNFYSGGYNYPSGYIGVEYSYIFESEKKNFLRIGYKQIVQIPVIKYLSPGINCFTDFKGYNGITAEFSLGLFQLQNVFTLYTRYSYNFQLIKGGTNFQTVSIGLYSSFFSLNF